LRRALGDDAGPPDVDGEPNRMTTTPTNTRAPLTRWIVVAIAALFVVPMATKIRADGVDPQARAAEEARERASQEARALVKQARALSEKGDLTGLLAVAGRAQGQWKEVNADLSTQCVGDICGMLVSQDYEEDTPRAVALAQTLAFEELARRPDMRIHHELRLVIRLTDRVNSLGGLLEGEAAVALRERQLAAWSKAWGRLAKALDESWKPARQGMWPTPPHGYPAGTRPDAIRDAGLRVEYRKEWDEHFARFKKDEEQRSLRAAKETYLDVVQRLIERAAAEAPTLDRAAVRKALAAVPDSKELEAFLATIPKRRG
jgi:hypothetical protein